MFSRILVPLDRSSLAEAALPPALGLAERFGSEVRFVHVLPRLGSGEITENERALDHDAFGYLAEVGARARAVATVSVWGDVRHGNVIDEIVSAADQPADLIVMTSHGRGGLARLRLGSVADAVVHRTARPVLVVRPPSTTPQDLTPSLDIERVVVPLDGSPLAESVLPVAVLLAEALEAPMVLVSCPFAPVQADSTFFSHGDWVPDARIAAEQGHEYLGEIARRVRSSSVEPVVHVEVGRHPASVVIRTAGSRGLVVMTTRGRSGLRRAALGSVADEVVRKGEGSVLLIRPVAHREPGRRVGGTTTTTFVA
jgi:nucleotide-binding universal stress UspA family protein